jgi:proteasome lid subunit RPN8/RPN11
MTTGEETNPASGVIAPLPLQLPRDLEQLIRAEAINAFPNECCGILYGRDDKGSRHIEQIEPVPNAFEDEEQYHRFSITPRMLLDAERKAASMKTGTLVLGFYHSHPDHPARPSEYDRTHAWPFYSYIIVASTRTHTGDLTSWQLDPATEAFVQETITLI